MSQPERHLGLDICWTRRGRTRHNGMWSMLCCFYGETPGLQRDVIARSRRKVLRIWSNGGRECLRFQYDWYSCAPYHVWLFCPSTCGLCLGLQPPWKGTSSNIEKHGQPCCNI